MWFVDLEESMLDHDEIKFMFTRVQNSGKLIQITGGKHWTLLLDVVVQGCLITVGESVGYDQGDQGPQET